MINFSVYRVAANRTFSQKHCGSSNVRPLASFNLGCVSILSTWCPLRWQNRLGDDVKAGAGIKEETLCLHYLICCSDGAIVEVIGCQQCTEEAILRMFLITSKVVLRENCHRFGSANHFPSSLYFLPVFPIFDLTVSFVLDMIILLVRVGNRFSIFRMHLLVPC